MLAGSLKSPLASQDITDLAFPEINLAAHCSSSLCKFTDDIKITLCQFFLLFAHTAALLAFLPLT